MGTENPIFYSLKQIEEQILERLTSEMLADSIHFSKYHYQRMFREVVGESVMRYVTKRKLSLAAKELSQGTSSILEIALKKEKCVMQYSKITDEILRELNNLIVQVKETASYTRKHTAQRIQKITEKTETISRFLTDSAFPHTYITEAFISLSHELFLVPPEEVTVCFLKDFLIRLDIITCSANQKTQSALFQKQLQKNITNLKKQINESILFIRDFPTDGEQTTKVSEKFIYHKPDLRKRYQDMDLQGKILLFYMEREIQQLEHIFTQEHQKTALDTLSAN